MLESLQVIVSLRPQLNFQLNCRYQVVNLDFQLSPIEPIEPKSPEEEESPVVQIFSTPPFQVPQSFLQIGDSVTLFTASPQILDGIAKMEAAVLMMRFDEINALHRQVFIGESQRQPKNRGTLFRCALVVLRVFYGLHTDSPK
jgi:hypothetical protein